MASVVKRKLTPVRSIGSRIRESPKCALVKIATETFETDWGPFFIVPPIYNLGNGLDHRAVTITVPICCCWVWVGLSMGLFVVARAFVVACLLQCEAIVVVCSVL